MEAGLEASVSSRAARVSNAPSGRAGRLGTGWNACTVVSARGHSCFEPSDLCQVLERCSATPRCGPCTSGALSVTLSPEPHPLCVGSPPKKYAYRVLFDCASGGFPLHFLFGCKERAQQRLATEKVAIKANPQEESHVQPPPSMHRLKLFMSFLAICRRQRSQEPGGVAVQVYVATGMWACHLAALVQSRLFIKRPGEVAHNALLLAIFASSGFKEEHTGLLAMTLPALLCCVPSSVRTIQCT